MVAGGVGIGGGGNSAGGNGGNPATAGSADYTGTAAGGGGAGTATAGGSGGTGTVAAGQAGSLGQGGNGVSRNNAGSGGGGGGYYGGGSGGVGPQATNGTGIPGTGGGGGSSWVTPQATSVSYQTGGNTSDGRLTLVAMSAAGTAPTLDGSNISNVAGTWSVNGSNYYYNQGNVGIGTSAPAGGLHVATGNGGVSSGSGAILNGAAGNPPNLELRGSGMGGDATTPYIDFAETSDVDYSTRLLSFGGTLYASNQTGSTVLQVNGNATVTGTLTANTFTQSSDARLKTDVRSLGNALASVLALRGVRYRWNTLGIRRGGQAGAGQVGLLAQELEKVYPELVATDAQGYKSVNYAQLAPVLIEALKEQQAQLEALKQQAAAATQRAAQAEASLNGFEQRLRALEAAGGTQAQGEGR